MCITKLDHHWLSPLRRQAIIWTNAGLLSTGRMGIYFSETWIKIRQLHWRKCMWICRSKNARHIVSSSRRYYVSIVCVCVCVCVGGGGGGGGGGGEGGGGGGNPCWRHQMETFSAMLALWAGIHRWIVLTKASDAELWRFLWSATELKVE